ncbi:MAG: hypothetical protein PHY45_02035 [Rhodocyclaceae bacterium]|nr:hypothetical protein [Rhodocyclaceae bacterium]
MPRSFEATVSREEFLRLLPAAVDGEAFSEQGDALIGASGWRMHLTLLPSRAFGGVAMECLRVDVEFPGWDERDVERFMRRFALFFQRGGG